MWHGFWASEGLCSVQFEWSQSPTQWQADFAHRRLRGLLRTQPLTAALQSRRLNQPPTDALVYLVVRYGLRRHIPIRLQISASAISLMPTMLNEW